MALSCKMGAYNRILNELLDINVPKGDIFLLFGPIDILVQFENVKSLEDFKERWFNQVRMIGATEDLIAKTLTFIVISEGPKFAEDPFAFIFMNAQPRNLDKVQKDLLAIREVLSADTVFGPYDVICPIKAKDRTDLERVIANIQKTVRGIEGSMTAVVALLRV